MSREDDLVTIGRFNHVGEAELARMALEAAEIDAVIADEYAARMGGHKSTGGVRLQVRRRDVDAANEVLQANEEESDVRPVEESYERHPDACRRCSSEEVYPKTSRGVLYARAVVAVIVLMFLLDFAFVPDAVPLIVFVIVLVHVAYESFVPQMQCRNCRAEWRGRQM